uniref:Uncharacterized protein n=1 Tax=Microviridae sp. ctuZ46 TaxID=2825010 RepID=A0A8S5UVN3_9VIRU|nr:MAG TPA: hypothetical protein [Microviridae sp. ctuZ46]
MNQKNEKGFEAKDNFIVRAVNEENEDFIITIGRHLATTKHFESKEEAERYIEKPEWDTTLALMAEMLEAHDQMLNNKSEEK